MNNNRIQSLVLCLLIAISSPAQRNNEADRKQILLADPSTLFYEGTWYLYGTGGSKNPGAAGGFLVYTSTDLVQWVGPAGARDGYALQKGDAFGEKGFWAPHVFRLGDRFYMAHTADEQIALASSPGPLGPFSNPARSRLEAPVRQIDPFLFTDGNGRKYLYHVRLGEGNRIFVAEMTGDLSGIKPETLKECIAAEESWENTASAKWPVAEGPTVIKHLGWYYLIYSANDFRNPDYAVGYATSLHPLGPWKKARRPFIHRQLLGVDGPGHGDFLKDKKGRLLYVLHTHHSGQAVSPRKTAIIRISIKKGKRRPGRMVARKGSFRYLVTGESE